MAESEDLMSTRSCIARPTTEGFSGRYVHWDGYPAGVGKELYGLYQSKFKGKLAGMERFLMDDHPAGWSVICGADWSQTPGFIEVQTRDFKGRERPQCFCHGDRREKPWEVTQADAACSGCEWVYVLHETPEGPRITVLSSYCNPEGEHAGQKMIGAFGMGDPKSVWKPVAVVDLDGPEPDWDAIR
jgi:hypothetical protein